MKRATLIIAWVAIAVASRSEALPPSCGSLILSPDKPLTFAGHEFYSEDAFRRFVEERGGRCATPPPTPAEEREVEALFEPGLKELLERRRELGSAALRSTSIPVAFHVIHDGNNGKLTQQQVNNQIAHLNVTYAGTGFSFTLSSFEQTNNRTWYRMKFQNPPSQAEIDAKNALHVDPYRNLNLYSVWNGTELGWATRPWQLAQNGSFDGVVIAFDTLPGGVAPYNEGDSATHEVGHWLGLFHTFHPSNNTCSPTGDYVADTNVEKTFSTGCPTGRNTCPEPGNDNIDNFLNFVDDCCMDTFTQDQIDRMQVMTAIHRSLL